MQYSGPYNYTLSISGPKEKRVIQKNDQNGEIVNFQKPVTTKEIPKIYILTSNNKIVYVGYTGQSIGSRLNYGMRANGKNGYHGYKWKKELDKVNLHVFVFEPFVKDEKETKKQKEFVEAIEAEIVFKVRNETGGWPKYQNEIHFNKFYTLEHAIEKIDAVTESQIQKLAKDLYENHPKSIAVLGPIKDISAYEKIIYS